MTKVIVHVGLPKCASTTIQRSMFRSYQSNLKNGICYPFTGREKRGYHSHRPWLKMSHKEIVQSVQDVRREAEKGNCKSIFISSEAFSENARYMERTSKIIRELDAHFGKANVELLMCVRNHVDYVESAYAQFLKGGIFQIPHKRVFEEGISDITKFVTVSKKVMGYDFFSYSTVIEQLLSHTEKDNLTVLSIEKKDLNGEDIVDIIQTRLKRSVRSKFALNLLNTHSIGKTNKVENTRFSPKCLLALNYSIDKVGFAKTKTYRKELLKAFKAAPHGFTPVLNASGKLYEKILAEIEKDKAYFDKNLIGQFDDIFEIRHLKKPTDKLEASIELSKEERSKIDSILSEKC